VGRRLDLGGLYSYAIEQYELDDAFRRAGLSAAISMGAAPGITNMLAAAAVAELDTIESIEVLDACVARAGPTTRMSRTCPPTPPTP
jgi:saccharopine dehydrogenase-like NADP-dependent oxidoreductase